MEKPQSAPGLLWSNEERCVVRGAGNFQNVVAKYSLHKRFTTISVLSLDQVMYLRLGQLERCHHLDHTMFFRQKIDRRSMPEGSIARPPASPCYAVRWWVAVRQDATGIAWSFSSVKYSGIALCSIPSSLRPPAFGVSPPHCLKKNGTLARAQMSRMSKTHSSRIGRAPGPLSPPDDDPGYSFQFDVSNRSQ